MKRVVAISDLHGNLDLSIPPCDLLIIAGDITPATRAHTFNSSNQAYWLSSDFRCWLDKQPAKQVIGIAGNHDCVFQDKPHLVPKLPWTYLQDSYTEWEGLKIWGCPWQPTYYDWAFNADDTHRLRIWNAVPTDINVVVCHGPPYGYGDRPDYPTTRPLGCIHFLERLRQMPNLQCAIFGHIHSGRGVYQFNSKPSALMANVAVVNEKYELTHPPTVFDVENGIWTQVAIGKNNKTGD